MTWNKDPKIQVTAEWAKEVMGWRGAQGGWIYDAKGRTVVQGWSSVLYHNLTPIKDWLTRKTTASLTFDELINLHPSYRPTILVRPPHKYLYEAIADWYDEAQRLRNDPRRCYRGVYESHAS